MISDVVQKKLLYCSLQGWPPIYTYIYMYYIYNINIINICIYAFYWIIQPSLIQMSHDEFPLSHARSISLLSHGVIPNESVSILKWFNVRWLLGYPHDLGHLMTPPYPQRKPTNKDIFMAHALFQLQFPASRPCANGGRLHIIQRSNAAPERSNVGCSLVCDSAKTWFGNPRVMGPSILGLWVKERLRSSRRKLL